MEHTIEIQPNPKNTQYKTAAERDNASHQNTGLMQFDIKDAVFGSKCCGSGPVSAPHVDIYFN